MKRKPEPFSAGLLTLTESGIIEIPFNYRLSKQRSYSAEATSSGFEFIAVTETIYTSDIDLKFASGGKVRMADGRVLSIKNIEPDHDEMKAIFDGQGLIGYYLYLDGGGE